MGEHSKIQWTDNTFNPWIGCNKVSPGCAHCYAERTFKRKPRWADCWGPNSRRSRTSDANWKKPIKWNKEAEASGETVRVFCASLADVFEYHHDVIKWREDLFELIQATPALTWQLLTKRPQHVLEMMPSEWYYEWPDNVQLGFSAENQDMFNKRILHVEAIKQRCNPKTVFVSIEPMLGPVRLGDYSEVVDWVIVGGESGPGARPMHTDWVRKMQSACECRLIPFFFKQWGEWVPSSQLEEQPTVVDLDRFLVIDDAAMYRVGKRNAPRTLDGKIYHQFP